MLKANQVLYFFTTQMHVFHTSAFLPHQFDRLRPGTRVLTASASASSNGSRRGAAGAGESVGEVRSFLPGRECKYGLQLFHQQTPGFCHFPFTSVPSYPSFEPTFLTHRMPNFVTLRKRRPEVVVGRSSNTSASIPRHVVFFLKRLVAGGTCIGRTICKWASKK